VLRSAAITGPAPARASKRSKKRAADTTIDTSDSDEDKSGPADATVVNPGLQAKAEQQAAEQFEEDLRTALEHSVRSDQHISKGGSEAAAPPGPSSAAAKRSKAKKRKGKRGAEATSTAGTGSAESPSHGPLDGQGVSLLFGGLSQLPKGAPRGAPPGLVAAKPSGASAAKATPGFVSSAGMRGASSGQGTLASIEAEVQRALIADRLTTALHAGPGGTPGSRVLALDGRVGLPEPKPEEGGLDAAAAGRLMRLLAEREATIEAFKAEAAVATREAIALRARLEEAELRPRAELVALLETERQNGRELGSQLGEAAGQLSRALSRVGALEGELRRRGF